MPTVSANAFIPRMNLGPDRIIQTPEDDIERRLKLAQLSRLEAEPGLQEREFQERRREFDVGQASRAREETTRSGEFERTLGETSKYHESEIADRRAALSQQLQLTRETHHAQVMDTVLKMLPYLGTPKGTSMYDVAAGVLKQSGYPELSDTFAKAHETELDKNAKTAATALQTASKNPEQYKKMLQGLEGVDKDLLDRIRKSVPEGLRSTIPGGKSTSTGGAGSSWDETETAAPSNGENEPGITFGRGEFQGQYPLQKTKRGLLAFPEGTPSYVNPNAVARRGQTYSLATP